MERMSLAPIAQPAAPAPVVAHARRRRAAWLDYLRVTSEADRTGYDAVELNAWEQLQRRLRRNDELLALAMHDTSATTRT